jgi:4-hydroxy-2-oxoheptanedioate aldolase
MANRLLTAMREKRLSLGVLDVTGSPELIEVMGHVGLDYVTIEMMFSTFGWERVGHLIRAAKASGITALVRVPCNPWVDTDETAALATYVQRALGIGAHGVAAHVASLAQAKTALSMRHDWHRQIHVIPFADDMNRFSETQDALGDETIIQPATEGETLIRDIDQVLDLEGLTTLGLPLSDITRFIGRPFDYEHPDLWRWIDRVASVAEAKGIYLRGNTGYHFQNPQDIAKRVRRLYDHGVKMVMVQTTGSLFQFFCTDILKAVRAELGPVQ